MPVPRCSHSVHPLSPTCFLSSTFFKANIPVNQLLSETEHLEQSEAQDLGLQGLNVHMTL